MGLELKIEIIISRGNIFDAQQFSDVWTTLLRDSTNSKSYLI